MYVCMRVRCKESENIQKRSKSELTILRSHVICGVHTAQKKTHEIAFGPLVAARFQKCESLLDAVCLWYNFHNEHILQICFGTLT